jgi:hypothetical protein
MKFLFLVFALELAFFSLKSQDLFKVISAKRTDVYGVPMPVSDTSNYYRIVLTAKKQRTDPDYPLSFPRRFDTLRAIKELLKYEGDTRTCAFAITCYNPARSQIYLGKEKNYSLQFEALYIINQLVFSKPFNYSAFPILVDRKSNMTYSISGIAISNAFIAYKRWYRLLTKMGISQARDKFIMPLDGSSVRWY